MPRYREKPISPFVQNLLNKYQCEHLSQLHAKTGIDERFLIRLADSTTANQTLEAHREAARRANMSMDDWVAGVLGA